MTGDYKAEQKGLLHRHRNDRRSPENQILSMMDEIKSVQGTKIPHNSKGAASFETAPAFNLKYFLSTRGQCAAPLG
jgi:hypothetical protein